MARMEILKPEALRVTRAHKAFQCCGQALRSLTDNDRDLYKESFMSEKISCFWSHSWHGGHWPKVLLIMMHYNGQPAVLLGSFAALVMGVCFICGLLPGFSRFGANDQAWSTWSLCIGFAATVITFFLWRPQQLVFLDRICISNNDKNLKTATIFSLAGILKKSDQMLVLWDPTWSERLWCVFELAAFLKSKETSKEALLIIRPTFLGPSSILHFITAFLVMVPATTVPNADFSLGDYFVLVPLSAVFLLLFVTGYLIAAAFRAYYRSIETLKEKLSKISFENTRCSCCDLGHVQKGGAPLLCDRQIVRECVSIWFGSEEAFEDYAQSEVLDALLAGLHDQIFTRQWSLSVSIPLLWTFLDFAVSATFCCETIAVIAVSIDGLVLWFLCAPIHMDLCTFFACRYCQRGTSTICELLENLKVELLGVSCFSVMAGTWFFFQARQGQERLIASAAFGGVWSTLALCHLLYKVRKSNRSLRVPTRSTPESGTRPS